MELGHHLPAYRRPWCLALPLPGDQRLEQQSGGIDVAEREEAQSATVLFSRACLAGAVQQRTPPAFNHPFDFQPTPQHESN